MTGGSLGLKHGPEPLVTPPTGQWFDYVLNVMLENHSINFTYYNGGSVNSCIGNCTYFTSLANANGLAMGLTDGGVNASTASYIAITSGYGNAAQQCNSGPNAAGCPYLQIPNIVDRLETAGLTWKAYFEGYPQPQSGCFTNYNSAAPFYYTPNHNPFLYYADIVNNTARCARIVAANSQPVTQNSTGCWPSALQNDDVLIKDLNSVVNASNYMWLTPNTVDQTHDCNDVSLGNAWLNKMVPQILGSTLFKTKRAALFVTFDEPGCTNPAGQPPCPSPPSQDVYSVWASNPSNPTTRSAFKSTQPYLLYSPLKAVEADWELSSLTTNDANANNMAEFFAVLSASFAYSPSSIQPGQQVTFTASASGGASPYTFNWRFGDGLTATGGTVVHTYNAAGIYNAQLTVTDKLGAMKNATQTITIGPNFGISTSPSSLAVRTGFSNTSRITVSSVNSFSGTVSLTTSVSPSGLTASLNVTNVNLSPGMNASSTLTVSSTNPATYAVNVTGTGGTIVHMTSIQVRVTTSDYNIAASPTTLTIQPSTNGTSTIQLTSLNQFSGSISLSATVSQPGLVTSLNPSMVSISSGGSVVSTLTFSSANYANYTITVTSISGTLSHSATVAVRVFPASIVVASDSGSGTTSLYTTGGQKLIQDSASKTIAVYVDSSGRISLSYNNGDPSKGGWSAPVKSQTPAFAYSWPAAVLVSLTSLRIIAVGGSVSGGIVDIPITISRGPGNNVTGFSFGTSTSLDSSGLGKYTAAILLHNNDILATWGWENTTTSIAKSLRWDTATGWTNLSGSSTIPDNVFVDTSVIQYFVPNMIERPDNHNVYLFALRFVSSGRVGFDKASWNGSGWSWGSQNLTYETGASDADDDAISLSWDPSRSMVVAAYGISGMHTYGVFTLTASDVKTHIDTPALAVAGDRGWGAVGVQTNTGDYYLFLISVNTDVGSGTLGYIRMPSGGSWNATITWLNTATDNQVTSLRITGPGPSLDLLYVEGTSSPANLKFVRLGAPSFTVASSLASITIQAGTTATTGIMLSSIYNFAGTVNLSTSVSPTNTPPTLTSSSVILASGSIVTSTLNFTPTASGVYTVTIIATAGVVSQSTSITVTVTDFSITASPGGVTVVAGLQGTSTITVTAMNGMTGTVTLSVSASTPTGLTCTLPASVTFGVSPQIASLNCSALSYGDYTVTVSGASGTLSHTTSTILFHVVDFSLSSSIVSPSQIFSGGSGNSTITVTALNGLTGVVSLTVSTSTPVGLNCNLPASINLATSSQTATLNCTSTVSATYTVRVTGTIGTLTHSTTSITFTTVDFTIAAGAVAPSQILTGGSGSSIITVTGVNGLSGTVNMIVSVSTPPGLTCTFPSSVTLAASPQTATLSCSSGTANTYTVTVTGRDGTLSHTTTTLIFTFVDFSMTSGAVSPAQILSGGQGNSTITIAQVNGLTGTVTLSVSVSTPAGLTCTFTPGSVTVGASPQTSSLVCTSGTANTYTVTVTGTDGTLSHSIAATFKVVDFTIAAGPVSPTQILAGATGTSAITVTSLNGLTGTVALIVSATTPAGLTCTVAPSVTFGTSSQTATLSCSSATANTYTVTLTGTGGTLSHTTGTITFVFADFTISAGAVSPAQILAGAQGTSTITVTALNSLNGTITLSSSASSPAGLTCAPLTNVILGASPQTATISCSATAANTYSVTVTGSYGILSHTTASITFSVVDFSISAGAVSSAQILVGGSGASTITVTGLNGLIGTVTLSASASTPSGLNCTLPTNVAFGTSPQSATLSCSATAANAYTVTVTGTDGTLSHTSLAITFTVADFTIIAGAPPTQVLADATGNSTITVNALNGLTGTAALTVSASTPAGLSCTLSPTSVTFGTSPQVSTLSCSSGTANTYMVSVTGADGGLSHSTTVLMFTVVDFSIVGGAVAPTQLLAGSSGASTITATSVNGLTGPIALTVSASTPAGLTCTLTPTSLTLGISPQTSTLNCTSGTAALYVITVTGATGTLSHTTATITFVVVDFTISASGVSPTQIPAGASGTSQITISAVNGLAGTVSLTASPSTPSGLTCSLTTGGVVFGTSPQVAALSCSTTVVGTYTEIVTGTDGSQSHSTLTISFTFVDFTIVASPVSPVQILAGSSGNSTISATSLNGLTGTAVLSVSASTPVGLTCTVPANVVVGNSSQTATLSCSSAAANTYVVSVTATYGTLSHATLPITFVIVDFSIANSPTGPVQVPVGSIGNSNISLTSLNGFAGLISLTTNSTSCILSSATIAGSGTSVLSCSFGNTGTVSVMVIGTSGSLTRLSTATFTVQDFAFTSSKPNITLLAGSAGTSTLVVTPLNGFSGAINLGSSNASCTLSPTVLTDAGNSTISCAFTSAGNYNLIVSATSTSLVHTTTLIFLVQDYGMVASSPAGSSVFSPVVSTITITPQNGFSGTVSLSDASQSGLNCNAITPGIINGQGQAVLSCTSAVAGNYTLTITTNSTTLTHSATVTFAFGDYGLTASTPPATSVGRAAASTIGLFSINHFSGTVTFSEIVPAGLICTTISPASLIGSGTTGVSCIGSSVGNYTLQILGISGSESRSSNVMIQISDFSISTNTLVVTILVGGNATSTIVVTSLNGYSGTVQATPNVQNSTSTGGGPIGSGGGMGRVMYLASLQIQLDLVVNPSSHLIQNGGIGLYTLSIAVPFGTQAGNYTITVQGADGQVSHVIQVTLVITDFTFSSPVNSLSISRNNNATTVLSLASLNGFRGNLTLFFNSNPVGPGVTLSPSSLFLVSESNLTLVVNVPLSVQPGAYTLTIQATTGTLSHTIYIVVQVLPGSSGLLASAGFIGANSAGVFGLLALVIILPHARTDHLNSDSRRRKQTAVPRHSDRSPSPSMVYSRNVITLAGYPITSLHSQS